MLAYGLPFKFAMSESTDNIETSEAFKLDVLKGLQSSPKYLQGKYFYDSQGDKLFQQIMATPEYYLTKAELEIFSNQCLEILDLLKDFIASDFDLIELGVGDALKSSQLLKCLAQARVDFSYYPIDISKDILQFIETELPKKIKGLKIKGIEAEYFMGLERVSQLSSKPRWILFLGGNIGNMPPREAELFLKQLYKHLAPGDIVLIGFDLKKNPWTIFNAYNDAKGVTKEFNINLLRRINRELQANFILENWDHYESYDPETGACKSYLISLAEQQVQIDSNNIQFAENEQIYMETSQKYTVEEIDSMAQKAGFKHLKNLFDSEKRFTDVIWQRL